jgi:hypothetical protein
MSNQTPVEQGPAPSIEQRAAAAFSNFMGFNEQKPKPQPKTQAPAQIEPEQPTEAPETAPDGETNAASDTGGDEAAPTAEEFFEFEVDGQRYQLPKPLEKAVMQERDYTQKSQKIAEQRKTYETLAEQARIANMQAEFTREIQSELDQLRAFDAVLEQQRQVDVSSMSTDELYRRKMQLDSWKEQRDAIKQGLEGKYREWTGKRDEAIKALRAKANETAASRIPGWNDATQKAVREHALSEGYTEAELEQAGLDPRHWVTLWKAQQFDAVKAKAAKTVTDVKSIKTTPSNPMPQQVKEKLAFNKQLQKTAPNSSERNKLVESRIGAMFAKR